MRPAGIIGVLVMLVAGFLGTALGISEHRSKQRVEATWTAAPMHQATCLFTGPGCTSINITGTDSLVILPHRIEQTDASHVAGVKYVNDDLYGTGVLYRFYDRRGNRMEIAMTGRLITLPSPCAGK